MRSIQVVVRPVNPSENFGVSIVTNLGGEQVITDLEVEQAELLVKWINQAIAEIKAL